MKPLESSKHTTPLDIRMTAELLKTIAVTDRDQATVDEAAVMLKDFALFVEVKATQRERKEKKR